MPAFAFFCLYICWGDFCESLILSAAQRSHENLVRVWFLTENIENQSIISSQSFQVIHPVVNSEGILH